MKNIKEKKNLFIIGGVVLVIIAFIIFGLTSSYATGEGTYGQITLECDKTQVFPGEKLTCTIKGTVTTLGNVSCLESEIDFNDNSALSLTKFTVADDWIGEVDVQGNPINPIEISQSGGKIYLFSETDQTATFNIGTFEVTVGRNIGDSTTNATISLKNTYFYNTNYEEKEISDASYNFEIIPNYLNFDDSLTVVENVPEGIFMISGIDGNTSIQTVLDKIDTSYTIDIKDHSNNDISNYSGLIKTGYTLNVNYPTRVSPFKISVKGDVTGIGKPSMASAMKIARHVIGQEEITGIEYLTAADVTGEGQAQMNDALKIAKFVIGDIDGL